uniref:HSF_DOMAIN domain-containing protein n=1 Tax=Macrostomum lignano TaxID=282301 RepID=A0A1I8FBW2_9PLAT
SYIYSECSPHQRTRWVMIRMKVNSDLLEMKYMMGFDWLKFPEISRILGQPQEPPVFTQTHPQFTLPLNTHDSVHPDERFLQEDWDVEACGDWEIMKDTTIVGVPSKLKLTISQEHPRGQSCYEWKEALGPIKDSSCKRAVYFRVDNDTGEVIHYPRLRRSYGLAVDMQKLPVCLRRSRECKAFEFSQNSFCRLHFISYSLNTMYAYESGTVYGRKSDTMTTSNPFTWNNPYHPYYRMLQDLLEETGFFHSAHQNGAQTAPPRQRHQNTAPNLKPFRTQESQPQIGQQSRVLFRPAQTRAPLPAAFRTTSPLFLAAVRPQKSKPRNAAQKQRQQVGPSQVSDPQPAAPAAAPQAVTSSAAEELQLLWASALGPLQPGGLLLPTTGLALLDQLLIQHHQHHQVLQLLQSQHQSGFPLGTTGNPLAYGFWMPTDEGVLAAAAAAASTEPSAPAADEPKDSAVKLVDEDAMEVRDEENSMEDDEAEDEEDRSSSANCSAGPHSAGSDGARMQPGSTGRQMLQTLFHTARTGGSCAQ